MGIVEAAHPYLPTSMELPGFHPALMSQMFILGTYGGASALVVIAVWVLSGVSPSLQCALDFWGFGGCGCLWFCGDGFSL